MKKPLHLRVCPNDKERWKYASDGNLTAWIVEVCNQAALEQYQSPQMPTNRDEMEEYIKQEAFHRFHEFNGSKS